MGTTSRPGYAGGHVRAILVNQLRFERWAFPVDKDRDARVAAPLSIASRVPNCHGADLIWAGGTSSESCTSTWKPAWSSLVAKDDPVETDIAADTVDGVLNNLVYALSDVQRGVYDGERKVIDALRSDMDLMTETRHANGAASPRDAFLPPRPALVGESMIPDIVLRDFRPS